MIFEKTFPPYLEIKQTDDPILAYLLKEGTIPKSIKGNNKYGIIISLTGLTKKHITIK